jgi:hypothetical protein
MKGYSEERGLSFKLDYDAESKQFISKPVAHAFAPQAESNVSVQKPAELRKRRQARTTKRHVSELLAAKGTDAPEDVRMTKAHAAPSQP